jgi:hypothetical protein
MTGARKYAGNGRGNEQKKNFSRKTWTAKLTVQPETWRRDNNPINREDSGYGGAREINVPQDKGQCKHGNEPYR